MGLKLMISSLSQEVPKADFLQGFVQQASTFINRGIELDSALYIYIKEIIENIYDHNYGCGYLDIEILSETKIIFTIGNFLEPNIVRNNFASKDKENFGRGISMIMGITPANIEIIADSSIKYKYQIIYKPI